MLVNNNSIQSFNGLNIKKIMPKNAINNKDKKYIQLASNRVSHQLGQLESDILTLTSKSDINRFNFLEKMATKFNNRKVRSLEQNADNVMNIYSMVEEPLSQHFSILSRTQDSFKTLEKIFSLAKDEKSLDFVQELQRNILKDSSNQSQIIIDLLSSKNKDLYINNIKNYSSYLKLHANDTNAAIKLENLIDVGRYSRLHSDAQYAVSKMMKKKNIEVAMAGETNNLVQGYTEEGGNFIQKIVSNFIPQRKAPNESTKATVIDMYNSFNSDNTKLRNAILDRFKYTKGKNTAAEIVEMKSLFDRIDKDTDARTFIQKAINKDLRVSSIAELNEIINIVPLKKANVFFNNAKRIIELSNGEERKAALIKELENPFFRPKSTTQKAKIVRMYSPYESENIFTQIAKIVENKFNKFIYSRIAA